jgi:hypothetical protein
MVIKESLAADDATDLGASRYLLSVSTSACTALTARALIYVDSVDLGAVPGKT